MRQDRDPFELLRNVTAPEPDPVVMQAVIAQSGEAFAHRRDAPPRINGSWLSRWLADPLSRLVVTGAAAAALVIVLLIAPQIAPTYPDSRGVATRSPAAPGTDAGTRLGMQPLPGGRPQPAPLPQLISTFQGDGVLIGTRLDATGLEIYLPDISGEQTIDVQGLVPGEQIEILSAFAPQGQDLVAIQIRVDDVRFWRIYQPFDGQYARDPERSRLVSDAPDRVEVERRLSTN